MLYVTDSSKYKELHDLSCLFASWELKNSSAWDIFYFDYSDIFWSNFPSFLTFLALQNNDQKIYFYALEPNPKRYFYQNFKKYPLIEFNRKRIEKEYFSAINQDPGGSSADALACHSEKILIFPPSINWYVYGQYDIELAKLVVKKGHFNIFESEFKYLPNFLAPEEVAHRLKSE